MVRDHVLVNRSSTALLPLGTIIPGKPFWRHREVGIENRQHVARRFGETEPDGIGLPSADLLKRANAQAGTPVPRRPHPLDLFPRAIARVPLDEDHLGGGAEIRHAAKRVLRLAFSVPLRYNCAMSEPVRNPMPVSIQVFSDFI